MRHEPFYTLVGIFVVGGLALMFLSGLFFYQQYTQAKVQTYVMFFNGSLKGLTTTAPVTYRGIKIGEVSLIQITENKLGNRVQIPVYVEFFVEKNFDLTQNPIQLLIKNGFVADISKPNFLTGISDVELVQGEIKSADYQVKYFRGYPIFPTRNSREKITTIDEALKSAQIMIEEITKLVRSPIIRETINSTDDTLKSAQTMIKAITKLARLPAIRETLSSTKEMTTSFNQLAHNIEGYLPPAINYFNQSVREVAEAANSFENLSDYLARHPEALLRGKP
ncbi:MlaD family protein [Legionella sp. D16C41]|uniref:MlaD family protein n=1 Tax=Legionella sp. D16C41 TaxID=3402688 RepID=UPI003AF41A2F